MPARDSYMDGSRTARAAVPQQMDIPGFGGRYYIRIDGTVWRRWKSKDVQLHGVRHGRNRDYKLTTPEGRSICKPASAIMRATYFKGLPSNMRLAHKDGLESNASQIMGAYDPTAWGVEKLLEPDTDAASVDDLKQTREWKPKKKAPAVRVDVVAASAALMDANMDVAADTVNDQVHRLQERLAAVSSVYKYAVIDCGLLLDMAALNALVAADLWIVPIKPGGFEVDGLQRVHEQLEELRQLNSRLELWVLPAMFGKSNTHKAVKAHLHGLGHRITLATIRRSVIAESYTAAAMPLPVYSPRCGVAKDYEALAYEVMAWNDESEVKA